MNSSNHVRIRPARPDDAHDAVEVLIESRQESVPSIPPMVHTDDEVREWLTGTVMASSEVWIAEESGSVVAVMVLAGPWLEQLYVRPSRTGSGIGSAMLTRAQQLRQRLDLWCFLSNRGARRFYESHGFVEVDRTDGDNEEGQPDIHYRWSVPG